ncbi:MAG: hypothetical protein KDD73_14755 [Anaerolineales bacterium]|nr:hypothetical protein [Anaerolineales bacterium]MCB9128657.1 hypothetical protein [Ardenticatenales bacterium]MCB9172889.1 hypothetical protein [Ardenticatenales bacterium]
MAYLKPQRNESDAEWQRLLREKVAGDSAAMRRVEALIAELRDEKQWEAAPPMPRPNGAVPHS